MTVDAKTFNTDLFQSLLERSPIGAVVIDPTGKVFWYNKVAREYFASVKVGRVLLQSNDWSAFRLLLDAKKPFYYLIDEQGYVFTPNPLDTQEELELLWIVPSDSMEVDLLEMQRGLIQQRKLANLGRMILEMVHELNNPLTSISMATQLMEMTMRRLKGLLSQDVVDKEMLATLFNMLREEINKISFATYRASDLRRELLAYSKPNELRFHIYNSTKLLQTCLEDLASKPEFSKIKIMKEFAENTPSILCDKPKFEQILYNLVKNAMDAMGGAGQITIREVLEPKMICIEVEDQGPGISDDMMDKIFSPFLTTKPRTGTGLGLSISKQIIQQHGGSFSVYNKEGAGACFQIRLPIHMDTRDEHPSSQQR